MLRILALPALGLTAVLALGTANAMAQAVKPGKGVPGGGAGIGAAHSAGGMRGGMSRGGMSAAPRMGGMRQGFSGNRQGFNGNPGLRSNPGAFGPRVGDNGRRRGGNWGPAAAIGAGVGLGLAAGYPYGGYYDNYSYPAYPGYSVSGYGGDLGNTCETPRRACQLYESAPIGADCSCRVPGGRAQGEVVD